MNDVSCIPCGEKMERVKETLLDAFGLVYECPNCGTVIMLMVPQNAKAAIDPDKAHRLWVWENTDDND